MFVLPFFLILILRQMNPLAFAALLVLYACADYAYFTRSGFLVKPYAAPYKEMADVIRDGSRGQNAIVAVDRYGSFSEPLVNRLGGSVRVIFLDDEASAREVLEAARSGPSGPSVIWLWRRTSDVSPGSFRHQTRAGPERRPRGSAPRIRCLQPAGALGSTIAARAWATRILLPSVRIPVGEATCPGEASCGGTNGAPSAFPQSAR